MERFERFNRCADLIGQQADRYPDLEREETESVARAALWEAVRRWDGQGDLRRRAARVMGLRMADWARSQRAIRTREVPLAQVRGQRDRRAEQALEQAEQRVDDDRRPSADGGHPAVQCPAAGHPAAQRPIGAGKEEA